MLDSHIVKRIKTLLTVKKWSLRKIVKLTGVSRSTVLAIAAKKWTEHPPLLSDEALLAPLDPPERCPTCGGMVFMPCLLCRLRDELAAKHFTKGKKRLRRRSPRYEADSFSLALKPQDRRRYEEIRASRKLAKREKREVITPINVYLSQTAKE